MADGARVDDTALLPNGAPSLLRVILIHAAYGNNAVAKGAKCMTRGAKGPRRGLACDVMINDISPLERHFWRTIAKSSKWQLTSSPCARSDPPPKTCISPLTRHT